MIFPIYHVYGFGRNISSQHYCNLKLMFLLYASGWIPPRQFLQQMGDGAIAEIVGATAKNG
jgi:hypothetical protein